MDVKKTIRSLIIILVAITALIFVSACSNSTAKKLELQEPQEQVNENDNRNENNDLVSEADSTGNVETRAVNEFELLRTAAAEYVRGPLKLLSTEEVYQNIVVAKDPSYQLISTRYEEDYLKGHIEGASWIVRTEFAYEDTIDKLDKDKKIVLYCYTASGATYVSAMLNLMGYDAYGMAIGMTEWTANREVSATDRKPIAIAGYPIETATNELTKEYKLPKLTTRKLEVADIVFKMGSSYFQSGQPRWIGAEVIKEEYDKDQLDHYQLIDVRSQDLYEKGHVPTAVNIPYEQTMDLEYLQKLPDDKLLIIISEDGQSATQISALYNFLGYDARTMLYGMMAWSTDPEMIGKPLWQGANDFPWVGTVMP